MITHCCFCSFTYYGDICEYCLENNSVIANSTIWICKCNTENQMDVNSCPNCNFQRENRNIANQDNDNITRRILFVINPEQIEYIMEPNQEHNNEHREEEHHEEEHHEEEHHEEEHHERGHNRRENEREYERENEREYEIEHNRREHEIEDNDERDDEHDERNHDDERDDEHDERNHDDEHDDDEHHHENIRMIRNRIRRRGIIRRVGHTEELLLFMAQLLRGRRNDINIPVENDENLFTNDNGNPCINDDYFNRLLNYIERYRENNNEYKIYIRTVLYEMIHIPNLVFNISSYENALNRAYLLLDNDNMTEMMREILLSEIVPFVEDRIQNFIPHTENLLTRIMNLSLYDNNTVKKTCPEILNKITSTILSKEHKTVLENDTKCIICYEKLEYNDNVLILPCCKSFVHMENKDCVGILPWFKDHDNRCPFCRTNIEELL